MAEAQAAGRPGAVHEDDEEPEPEGWRDGAESRALDATIGAGLARNAMRRGRAPPQSLPRAFSLEEYPANRPLAEALGVVRQGRDLVECPDFAAAVARARAEGRGEAVDRALAEPTPLEQCRWLSEEEKAAVLRREAESLRLSDAAAAEVAAGAGWPGDEPSDGAEAQGGAGPGAR